MADVQRSPFDLRSWQGLTAVLKAARESSLSPLAYSQFRNIVLEYAQKGGDAELKKKIDAIISTFGTPDEKKASDLLEPKPASSAGSYSDSRSSGRRITPMFTETKAHTQVGTTTVPSPSGEGTVLPPPLSIGKEEIPEEKMEAVAAEVTPPPVISPVVHIPEPLMTLEENRARIVEIKHRVNALVGNPVTLMDKGNGIGRAYMGALLAAMKATSPGSTMNVHDAMQKLEVALLEILAFTATKNDGTVVASEPVPVTEPLPPTLPPVPVPHTMKDEITAAVPALVLSKELDALPVDEVPITLPEPLIEVPTAREAPVPVDPVEEQVAEIPVGAVENDSRWSADDEEISKRRAKETTGVSEESDTPKRAVNSGRRSFLPSLIDIEEDTPSSQNSTSTAEPAWHSHTVSDDLSVASVMRRPESSMTGITLGTPQAELMSKPVTVALEQLLHEWNIFSASGLFGMGPGGMDHPVYKQIASLTMGEVLSSRWENANPKVAHSVKDYADAWRHEQSIAYTPTETFEHYLRRVAQRIMKRKSGEIIVT